MSFSSWPSRWQCHTYSQPKLVITLVVPAATGAPGNGAMGVKFTEEPAGIVGSSRRLLSGIVNGSVIAAGRIATIMSSNGFVLMVSFQPNSSGVGRLYGVGPVNPVDHLHVEQVEVDGMGVNAYV